MEKQATPDLVDLVRNVDREVMKYLRNIVRKLQNLGKRMDDIESTILNLSMATGQAFYQTKHCITELAMNQEDVQQELSHAVGNIEESSWCDPVTRTRIV